jgi:hypothetical protein
MDALEPRRPHGALFGGAVMNGEQANDEPDRGTRLLRIAEHLRTQNWTAIAIDFVIVVLGVFVGIQVANWNDERRTQQREAEFIARLHVDFERIDARLTEDGERWERNLESSKRLLSDLAARRLHGTWRRNESAMLVDLNNITSTRSAAPRAATYVEMQSAAQLGILRDTRLRDALRDYDVLANRAAGLHATLVQRTEPFRIHLVSHLTFDAGLTRESLREQVASGATRADYFDNVDLDALAADPTSRVALTQHASTFLDHLLVIHYQQESARAALARLREHGNKQAGATP